MTNKTIVNVGIVGVGLVGSDVIEQLQDYENRLRQAGSQNAVSQSSYVPTQAIKIIALANSKKAIYAPQLNLNSWKEQLSSDAAKSFDLDHFIGYLADAEGESILIDNTSSIDIAKWYPVCLERGLHLVTPNKKGFSDTLELYQHIRATAQKVGKFVYHESTVGAGLPILSTLGDLLATGDQVTRIEGVLSGTLSYIFNEYGSSDAAFSDIVRAAKENGYTEPDPRDDLNGMDVARKLTILARIIGLPVPSASAFSTRSLIPLQLESAKSGDEFMSGLPAHDAEFDKMRKEAKSSKKVLRYVGVIDVAEAKNGGSPFPGIKVDLVPYDATHPFASLQGADNVIAIYTTRYPKQPLIIQGAGAGAAVTAMGVVADVIRVAQRCAA